MMMVWKLADDEIQFLLMLSLWEKSLSFVRLKKLNYADKQFRNLCDLSFKTTSTFESFSETNPPPKPENCQIIFLISCFFDRHKNQFPLHLFLFSQIHWKFQISFPFFSLQQDRNFINNSNLVFRHCVEAFFFAFSVHSGRIRWRGRI